MTMANPRHYRLPRRQMNNITENFWRSSSFSYREYKYQTWLLYLIRLLR